MNMFYNQVRQSEKVEMALHKWTDKPPSERTYEELLERSRAWIVDRRRYENFMKITNKTSVSTGKPTVAAVEDGGKKKKKNNRKKTDDAQDSSAEVNAVVKPSGAIPKTRGKCMNFQTQFGAKGCDYEKKHKKKCPYEHVPCDTKEEFDKLVDRVSKASATNGGKNGSRTTPDSVGKQFRAKFCRFDEACKFKDVDGDKKCCRDHTTYKSYDRWKEGLKAAGGAGSSSDGEKTGKK